ncbi:DUF6029 family protein [Flavobacterium sp.]|uniref:DUF6029 family protein n=1 Tax=Flavobacterium sp. TaxID=239 RepID=UPI003529C09E
MKKKVVLFFLLIGFTGFSQQNNDSVSKTKIKFYGGLESNGQWYTNDPERAIQHPEEPFRSNNYLQLNANYGRFTVGTQIESYYKDALLNYNPQFVASDFGGYNSKMNISEVLDKIYYSNISTFYANYKSKMLNITAGHFYEQFGSGLLLRAWEDRSLGINTAIRGGKVNFTPIDAVSITALYGKQKTGFQVSESNILGVDSNFDFTSFFNIKSFDITGGFSYVMRDQAIPEAIVDPKFDRRTGAYAGRLSFSKGGFYISTEYNEKEAEPIVNGNNIDYDFIKKGNALLINLGYSKKGLGIDASLRRVENMLFLADREPVVYGPEQTSLNYNDRFLNFVPALTKQHHSNLANIYVYQAQSRVNMDITTEIQKFGEIGGQLDVFYNFKKGTTLGGKYGTKIALNISNWFNLDADYSYYDEDGFYKPNYTTKFLAGKEKYFSDYNIEVSKKFSKSFKGNFVYINQYYNDQYIRGIFQENVVKSNIIFAEGIYNFSGSKAITIGAEHMWADNDRGNWASLSAEYNHNLNWSIYVMDMYNYGYQEGGHYIAGNIDAFDIHFYNAGVAYKKGASRVSVGYGRQRGGLVCAGGVCRFVPPSTGLSFSITTSF